MRVRKGKPTQQADSPGQGRLVRRLRADRGAALTADAVPAAYLVGAV